MARWMDGHLEQCRVASMVASVNLVQLENPLFSLKTSKKHSFVSNVCISFCSSLYTTNAYPRLCFSVLTLVSHVECHAEETCSNRAFLMSFSCLDGTQRLWKGV